MIGKLDQYLLRTFLLFWLVLGGVLLGLFTVLDLIGHGDELAQSFDKYGPIAHEIARYYVFNMAFLLVQFAPYLTLLAALATVMQVGRAREWTPMLVAGRSTLRSVMPFFLGAGILALGVVLVREQALPRMVVAREALSRKLFNQREWKLVDAWARSSDDQRLRAGRFLPRGEGPAGDEEPEIRQLEVFLRDASGREQVVRATSAVWDGDAWQLQDGRVLAAAGTEAPLARFSHPQLRPRDLILAHLGAYQPLDLSTGELEDLLERDPENRQAATLIWAWRVAPLGHWVLLLLGLPFTLRLNRRSAMEGVARGLLLCMLFFVAEFVLRDLGGRGVVSPFLGGCGPTLLFGSLGLWALDRLPT